MLHLCKLTDSLFISNSRSACDDNLLLGEGVTFCINVSKQQPFPGLKVGTLRIPVFDDPAENLYKYFDRCADVIEDVGRTGGRTLVYCKNGRSRSASICTAYLMKYRCLSLREAFEYSNICCLDLLMKKGCSSEMLIQERVNASQKPASLRELEKMLVRNNVS